MSGVDRMSRAPLAYAERFQFAVFPCHWIRSALCSCGGPACGSPGKHPLTKNGLKDATKEAAQIRAWWKRWPDANIGIATGAVSGIVVLDIDPRHGGDESLAVLEAEHGKLPDTPVALTGGGGLHIYFRHPGAVVANSAGRIGPGIDVRGNGGYVIAPRSIHQSGNRYLWEVSSRIDELPLAKPLGWLLELLLGTGNALETHANGNGTYCAMPDLERLLVGVPEGDRDSQLFRLACYLRRLGYSRVQAEPVLLDAAARCKPPFPGGHALRKWRWQ